MTSYLDGYKSSHDEAQSIARYAEAKVAELEVTSLELEGLLGLEEIGNQ